MGRKEREKWLRRRELKRSKVDNLTGSYNFSPNEISGFVANLPMVEEFLMESSRDPERVIQNLTAIRITVNNLFGEYPSNPFLCSEYLLSIEGEMLDTARELVRKNTRNSAAFLVQVAFGFLFVVNSFSFAENQLDGEDIDKQLDKVLRGLSNIEDPLKLGSNLAYFRRYTKEAANVYREDPTGFKLTDYVVDKMKSKDWVELRGVGSYVPEFVILGAEFARRAYKKIYPMTGRLPQT